MAKEDYREKIEEDRQEIEIESTPSRISRASRKHKKKQRKSYGMKVLLVVFIFIPLSFLIYFNWFYEPKPVEKAESKSTNEVQVVTSNTPNKEDAPNNAGADEEKDQSDAEAKKAEAAKKAEEEAARKAEEERLAQEKEAEEASKQAAEQAKKAEEEKRKQEQQAQSARKHVVQPNDTLYSIAMKYYKDPSAVDKIAKANGIKNNNITVGSTLILP